MVVVWRSRGDEGPPESRLLALALRLGVYIGALWLAERWVRGVEIEGWPSLVAAAAILWAINSTLHPVAQLLGCPFTCLTLGLFALVINAAMFALAAWIAGQFGLDVDVEGFWAAFLGALLVTFVVWLLGQLVERPLRRTLR